MAKYLIFLVVIMTLLVTGAGQAARSRLDLDGPWQLLVDADEQPRTINVPGCWQSQFPELRGYSGKGLYSRKFSVPEEWRGKAIILHFGAVDYYAEVRLNGRKIGSDEGGYTPFEFRIEDSIGFGEENELEVIVLDPRLGNPVGEFDFAKIPHGKQSWYGNVSGIWQSVYVEARDPVHIKGIKTIPDIKAGVVEIESRFSSPGVDGFDIVTEVIEEGSGRRIAAAKIGSSPLPEKNVAKIAIPDVKLWSPEEPNLYLATVRIEKDGQVVDEQSITFGMRKIEAKDGKLYLNNHQIFLISALDQDFYPMLQYTVPSDDYIKDQFEKAKHLGLNSLRCHIKVPDPRYLEWADRLGLLIWYEIPNWMVLSDSSKRRAKETLDAMIARDWNHPSIVIISIMNEAWGIDLSKEDQRKWLLGMYDYAKSLDTGRLIVDNSPCGGNFHMKTDIEDFHAYFSLPEDYRRCAAWIADLAERPSWTFSPHGDAVMQGWEPIVYSEFGNWGLPSIPKLKEYYGGEDPWWFRTDRGGATRAEGALERFEKWGLDKVFGDWDGMAREFQWQEWRALKYQIEEMRKHPSISGYVITEFTDLQWESNGLLDYCRNPKVFHDVMHTIQAQDVIVPNWSRTSYWGGEKLELPIIVSHFSQTPIAGCKLRWRIEALGLSGEIENVSVETASAREVGRIDVVLPEANTSANVSVAMELQAADGEILTRNSHEFLLMARRDGELAMPVFAGAAADKLTKSGANLVADVAQAEILVLDRLDKEALAGVRNGKTAVFVAKDSKALGFTIDGPRIEDRAKEGRWGSWCNSLIWLKPELFDCLPFGRSLDYSFIHAIPSHVINGFDPEADQDDILSGIFVGWVHSPAAITAGFRCGKGKVLLTTLPLLDAYSQDPVATAALNRLVRYAASPAFVPKRKFALRLLELTETPIPTAEEQPVEWRYTLDQPAENWEAPGFDDSAWKNGKAGFGKPGTPNAIIGTQWTTSDIWLRYEMEIAGPFDTAVLRFYHDENVEVYINGAEILRRRGFVTSYDELILPQEALAALRPGKNTVAVHCRQTIGGQYIDIGLKVGHVKR